MMQGLGDGGKFVNALRSSVRPVITYIFMGLFIAVEVSIMVYGLMKLQDYGLQSSLSGSATEPFLSFKENNK